MPLPEFSINTVSLELRNLPHNLPDSERHKALALAGCSYGAGIFNLIAHVSRAKLYSEETLLEPDPTTDEEFDAALYLVGMLGKGLIEETFAHVMEMAEAFEKEIDELRPVTQTSDQLAA